MFRVIGVVATLTQGTEVGGVAMFGGMVEVGYCEDNLHFLTCFGVESQGVIFNPAELAPVVSPFKYGGSDLLPILGVSVTVFGSYRHSFIRVFRGYTPHSRYTRSRRLRDSRVARI